jgi:phosphoglycerol transferase MdoB-like AlkP superfamily enzyme
MKDPLPAMRIRVCRPMFKRIFQAYAKRPDFNNTIFVITGDHSCGNRNKNFLSSYHVP